MIERLTWRELNTQRTGEKQTLPFSHPFNLMFLSVPPVVKTKYLLWDKIGRKGRREGEGKERYKRDRLEWKNRRRV